MRRTRLSTYLQLLFVVAVGGGVVGLATPPALAAFADVTTFAGSAVAGSVNGTGSAAAFYNPNGMVTDSAGNLFVADGSNNQIRKVSPAGVVTSFVGSSSAGSTDGSGASAQFSLPSGLAIDSGGNVYVGDYFNNMIRKVTPAGVVTTLAGSGLQGSTDATGAAASFFRPWGVAMDSSGNVLVADSGNNKIRRVTPAGVVTTLAGSGAAALTNGTGAAAAFNTPTGLTVDAADNIFVCDDFNRVIRKVTPGGVVSTFAGSGATGSVNGTGLAATFNTPTSITTDGTGNMYVADRSGRTIRMITPAGVVTTLAGGAGGTTLDGNGSSAGFNYPIGITADAFGHVFVSEDTGNVIRRIDIAGSAPAATTTTITTVPATTSTTSTTTVTASTTTAVPDTTTTAPTPAATTTTAPTPAATTPLQSSNASATSLVPGTTGSMVSANAVPPGPSTVLTSVPSIAAAPVAVAAPATPVLGDVTFAG